MELDSVVFYRLFVPEWPSKRDRHRGGIHERGVSVPEGIRGRHQILVQTPVCVTVEDVETTESEREVRRGRVSIRDRPASLTFTVTLESLREEDSGTYGCGIYVPLSRDPTFQVEVSVIPVSMTTTSPKRSTSTPESPTTWAVPTWSAVSGQEAPDPGQAHRPLLGSVHFLLLVFLKVPLLLGMLGAALWVNRPLRSSADRQSQSIYENW
ncbi:CMRF35-like molecule 6 [Bos indicus]|uniref:CMRF35-like molecule 6 n=1 Tax=Bos indicus TaxID=9915 RepID=A0A6P5DIW3_BOSIN